MACDAKGLEKGDYVDFVRDNGDGTVTRQVSSPLKDGVGERGRP